MSETSWMSEAIVDFLGGPCYIHPLMTWIDDHCMIFTPEEENKLEYTVLHNQFQELVDQLLTDFLEELGVSPEIFFAIASADHNKDKLTSFVVQTILTVDDFLLFKAMMVKRNIDLTTQVLGAYDELKYAVVGPGEGSPVFPGSPTGAPVRTENDAEMSEVMQASQSNFEAEQRLSSLQRLMRSLQLQDEDVALAIAIAESLKHGARSQSDQADMEQALALSLALEAERLRMLKAGSSTSKDGLAGTCRPTGTAAGSSSSGSQLNKAEYLQQSFPEPKPMGMAPLPQLQLGSSGRPAFQSAPLAPLQANPNASADQLMAIAAAAASAAGRLGGLAPLRASVSGNTTAGSQEVRAKVTPQPLNVGVGSPTAASQEPSKGRFVPVPLNLPDKNKHAYDAIPSPDDLKHERTSGGKRGNVRGGAGYRSTAQSVQEAARSAALAQKSLLVAGADGDGVAQAWLQDAKLQLVAQKKQEREAEMQQFQEKQKKMPAKAGGASATAGDELEAKRSALRDKLAQKFKQDMLQQSST